jgi:hypothetical protein
MASSSAHSALRDVLAQLYPDAASQGHVIADAGLDAARVPLGAAALHNWDAILTEAAKQEGDVDRIISIAVREYKRNRRLLAARDAYLASVETDAHEGPVRTPTPRDWPITLVLLIAFGGPLAGLLAFAQTISQDPWRALGLLVLYETVLLVLSYRAGVRQVIDWLDGTVQPLLAGYQRKYLRYVTHQCHSFDEEGLGPGRAVTLELGKIFVNLTLVLQPPQKASANPLREMPRDLRKGGHSIWEYLAHNELANHVLVVLGPPGSGKTTELRYIALTLAAPGKERGKLNAPNKLPILLLVSDLANGIAKNRKLSLAQAVADILQSQNGPHIPARWFERQLGRGRFLVMLDGLDGVAKRSDREDVVAWVQRQINSYSSGNRFLVTSRPHGYQSNPLIGEEGAPLEVAVLEIAPFSTSEVRDFARRWYLDTEIKNLAKGNRDVEQKAEARAKDLILRLQGSDALWKMAANPLLLTMMANVDRYGGKPVPEQRVELYADVCEVFLDRRKEAWGVFSHLTVKTKERVLQALAYEMMLQQTPKLDAKPASTAIADALVREGERRDPEAFLEGAKTSGLMIESEQGTYRFSHQTFQEYLASMHVKEQGRVAALEGYVDQEWWHGTIRFYCAHSDATSIFRACLAGDPPRLPALTLACQSLDEAKANIQAEVRDQMISLVKAMAEDPNPDRQHLAAGVLLVWRAQHATQV